MQQVTIRELMHKGSAEPVAGAEHVTTDRRQPVANVPPVNPSSAEDMGERIGASTSSSEVFWARWGAIAAKIGASIRTDLTAAEMVAEQRRIL